MYTLQPKKLLIINILDILEKYTDEDHKLSQRQIEDILESEYMMNVDRKAVRRNLMDLVDSDYIKLGYTENTRIIVNKKTNTKEESSTLTDFYVIRDITNGELKYLVDSVLSSRHIPECQGRDLIEKIEALGGAHFKSHSGHIKRKTGSAAYGRDLFYNIEMLDEAISSGKKVTFNYSEFGEDKKPRLRLNKDGSVKSYLINPYQMAVNEGKYYLICNPDKYDDISHFRIDRIRNVVITDEKVKPFKKLKDASGGELDINTYMDEHIYMFSGNQSRVKFMVVKEMMSDIVDVFGTGFSIRGTQDKYLIVEAKVNENAMLQYAKEFAPDVIVMEPKPLAKRIAGQLEEAVKQYKS